jgi:hypothetical protein
MFVLENKHAGVSVRFGGALQPGALKLGWEYHTGIARNF